VIAFTLSPSTIGSVPCGYLLRWSTPWNQPAKWKGIQATPLPTRSVNQRLHAGYLADHHFRTGHQHPGAILDARSAASAGLISTKHVLLQLGEPLVGARFLAAALVFHQAARVRMIGSFFAMPLSTAAFCIVKPLFGMRNCLASGSVGYLATSSGRGV